MRAAAAPAAKAKQADGRAYRQAGAHTHAHSLGSKHIVWVEWLFLCSEHIMKAFGECA